MQLHLHTRRKNNITLKKMSCSVVKQTKGILVSLVPETRPINHMQVKNIQIHRIRGMISYHAGLMLQIGEMIKMIRKYLPDQFLEIRQTLTAKLQGVTFVKVSIIGHTSAQTNIMLNMGLMLYMKLFSIKMNTTIRNS